VNPTARVHANSALPVGYSILAVMAGLLLSLPMLGQNPMPSQSAGIRGSSLDVQSQASGSGLNISVREPNGLPVTQSVTVKLSCPLMNVQASGPTVENGLAQFSNVPEGDCFVEVSGPGYKTARERAVVVNSQSGIRQAVYIYLHSDSEVPTVSSKTAVSLDVLKEMDRGSEAMRKSHPDDARKHFLKAAEHAPQNPDVQYLLGTLEANQNNSAAAKQHYERAIALYPTHEHALLDLGEMQLRENHAAEAAATLERAVQANILSFRAQFYLAQAYLQQQNFTGAEQHARKAVELGAAKQPMALVLLGKILTAENQRPEARQQYELVLHQFPNDAAAAAARKNIEELEKPAEASVSREIALMTLPVAARPVPETPAGPAIPWGPADVDSSLPGVATDVSCSADDVVRRAGLASTQQLDNFEKFMATERIEHEEIDRHGDAGHVKAHNFSYLVFIDHDKSGQVFLKENRDGGTGLEEFPTSLATVGLLGLGIDVFHPGFAAALDFNCEGLGQWRGKAAWIMHFRQKPGQRSYLRLWQTQTKTVEVPLKGRVWVAASSYEVLHLETDLRDPMSELELTRDHLSIDYGPVSFQNGKTEMWLPWSADMYLELHHHRYHHRHTLSKYSLFTVDTNNTIGRPKGADAPEPEAP
jgi:tetratricopeptide (TPR) repeat protein